MSQIQNIMANRLLTIPSGSTLSQATLLMQERRIRHLPVVTESGAVLGILSSKNLPIFSELKEMSVDFFMTTDLIFVLNDSSIKEAIYKISSIHLLILLNNNQFNFSLSVEDQKSILNQFYTAYEYTLNNDLNCLSEVLNMLDELIQLIENQ